MSKKRHHRKRAGPEEPDAAPSSEVPSSRRSPVRWAVAIGAIAVVAWFGAPRLLRTEAPPSPHRPDHHGTTLLLPRPARMTEMPDAIEVRVPLSDARTALRIVWIGDLRARVDACECHRNLRLAFVATLFRRLAAGPPRTLLLDVGGAIDGASPLDRARQETYAAALKDLGFAAIAVGAGRGYLSPEQTSALASVGPPLLTLGGPALRVPLGRRSIAFACADSPPVPDIPGSPRSATAPRWSAPDATGQAASAIAPPRAQGDLVVLLGDLSRGDAERIAALPAAPDVILSARPIVVGGVIEDAARRIQWEDCLAHVGRTSIFGVPASSFGAVRWLELAEDGTTTAYGFFQPSEAIAADPQVTSRVDALLKRVEAEPALAATPPRRFASEPRENDASDGYIGGDACIRCHAKQGTQWRGTRHSEATKALETIDRHYYPGCITCHSTGYGWPTGYRTRGGVNGSLRDVGCETCHGPGKRHSESPKDQALIRHGSSTLCLECHDGREAKPLGDGLSKAYERIRHRPAKAVRSNGPRDTALPPAPRARIPSRQAFRGLAPAAIDCRPLRGLCHWPASRAVSLARFAGCVTGPLRGLRHWPASRAASLARFAGCITGPLRGLHHWPASRAVSLARFAGCITGPLRGLHHWPHRGLRVSPTKRAARPTRYAFSTGAGGHVCRVITWATCRSNFPSSGIPRKPRYSARHR